MLVAVYGTLKVGYDNYDRYLSGMKPVYSGFVEVPYRMYANDEYPMLVRTADVESHGISIEVFDVDEAKMKELDALEAPYGYSRETIRIPELEQEAVIYVHAPPAPMGFARVESGDWKD